MPPRLAAFLLEAGDDDRISCGSAARRQEVLELYNRAKFLYHPSSSDFGPRCIWEALYTGAIAVIRPYPWASTATANPDLWSRILIAQAARSASRSTRSSTCAVADRRAVRQGLLDMLAERHAVNRRIEPFTMFSSTRVPVAAGSPTLTRDRSATAAGSRTGPG